MRRLAGLLWQAEERPAASGAARTADVAIAVVATLAAVVAVIVQARTSSGPYGILVVRPGISPVFVPRAWVAGWPSPWILLGAAMTTAPLAFRRIYPITAFCVIMVAVIATSGYTTSITFAAVIFAAYTAAAYSPFRRAALLSVLAAAIIVTAAYPDTSPPVPARFGALLVLLPTVSVAIAIRMWRRRVGESAERLRRAQAEHEAETRRAVELERARIASEMHDVVTHNVSVMVVQAGAARRVLDSSPDDAPARTTVRLEYRPRDLLITVSDDGPPPGAAPAAATPGSGPGSDGRGLIGLRERIAVYGGELDAGPRPGGGWRLAARIPLEPAAGELPVPPSFQAASR